VSHTSHGKIQKWLEPLAHWWCKIVGAGSQECRGARHPISNQKKEVHNYHVYPSKFVLCKQSCGFVTFCFLLPKSSFFFCLVSPLQESQILAAMTATRQLVKNTYIYLVFPRGKYLGQTDKKFNGPSKYEKNSFSFLLRKQLIIFSA
jgi:hypothetical protein